MPSTSMKQHRAMRAAASGKSNIGIPPKVGKEFVKADVAKVHSPKGPKTLAGVFARKK
jgi:hypothetical protein